MNRPIDPATIAHFITTESDQFCEIGAQALERYNLPFHVFATSPNREPALALASAITHFLSLEV
jgi:hypothetical protein